MISVNQPYHREKIKMQVECLILLIVSSCCYGHKSEEDHICRQEKRFYVNVTQHFIRNATVRNYQWCLHIPPRCSTYSTKPINDTRIVEEERVETVESCCPGYHEEEGKCLPDCSNETCIHGHCQKDHSCKCGSGYSGERCDMPCDQLHWGRNCQHLCKCLYGHCHPGTGQCLCLPGWTGEECTTHCLRGYYGNNCQETCECNEDEQCNFVTGMCLSSVTQVNEDTNAITESTFYTSSATELMANLRQLNRSYWNNSYRKPPTLQKYYTFDVTTISTLNANQLGKEDRFPTKEIPAQMESEGSSHYKDSKLRKEKHSAWTPPPSTNAEDTYSTANNLYFEHAMFPADNIEASHTNEGKNDSIYQANEPATSDGLLYSMGTAVGVTILIIISAFIIVITYHSKKKKNNEIYCTNPGRKTKDNKGHSVSVYTKSVFHGTLPEIPPFNNPVFCNPEGDSRNTFETRVVYSMNFHNGKNKADPCTYLYDHPPSTGSYRAASIPEPPDTEVHSIKSESTSILEPVYDEIPCCKRPVELNKPPPPYSTNDERSSFYMNTDIEKLHL